jgi:hypothetical protein
MALVLSDLFVRKVRVKLSNKKLVRFKRRSVFETQDLEN